MNFLLQLVLEAAALNAEVTLASTRQNAQQQFAYFEQGKTRIMEVFASSCEHRAMIEDLKILHMFRYAKAYKYFDQFGKAFVPHEKRDLILQDPEPFLNLPRSFWKEFNRKINEEIQMQRSWEGSTGRALTLAPSLPTLTKSAMIGQLMGEIDPLQINACIVLYVYWATAAPGNLCGLQYMWKAGHCEDAIDVTFSDIARFHRRQPEGLDWEPLRRTMMFAIADICEWSDGRLRQREDPNFDAVW
jgi:hypothetical protein